MRSQLVNGTMFTGALLAAGLVLVPSDGGATPTFGAFAQVTFAGTDGGWGDFDATRAWSANNPQAGYTVAAQADLPAGSLHASTLGRYECGTYSCATAWGVGASARLFDRYTFTNTGENIALIPVSLRVDGNCAGDAMFKRAQYRFAFSSGPINTANVPFENLPCDGSVDVVAPINLVSFLGDTSFYAFVEISTGVFFPGNQGGWALVDFSNTLKVEITLPPGVTMRSDSGVFPYQYATNISEPATLATLGAGLVGLGLMRRRRAAA